MAAAVAGTTAQANSHRHTGESSDDDQSPPSTTQAGWPGPALGWPTNGRPATEKDLVGKTICWDNGHSSHFGANGQFSDGDGHHRKWLVTEPGVVEVGIKYTQYLILPDGSFYHHWYAGHKSITGHKEHWGKVCT